jgi:hypothetical protein
MQLNDHDGFLPRSSSFTDLVSAADSTIPQVLSQPIAFRLFRQNDPLIVD